MLFRSVKKRLRRTSLPKTQAPLANSTVSVQFFSIYLHMKRESPKSISQLMHSVLQRYLYYRNFGSPGYACLLKTIIRSHSRAYKKHGRHDSLRMVGQVKFPPTSQVGSIQILLTKGTQK